MMQAIVNEWFYGVANKDKNLNPEIITIIQNRIEIFISKNNIKSFNPELSLFLVLNSMIDEYDGILYEENEIMMEVDIFLDKECTYLYGLGDTPIFREYIIENFPELLI